LTEDDQAAFTRHLGGATRVVVIPNASPNAGKVTSPLDGTIVVAAGALVPRKGFDRLIEAFAPLVPAHPEWQLHIYGKGGERARLLQLIEERGLTDNVFLKGFDPSYQERLRDASVFALTSHFEAFPMVIVEALGAGLPVVAFDCPSGPRHQIRDGVDGILVPNDDVPAFTKGLARMIEDEAFRKQAGAEAAKAAAASGIDAVVARWKALFEEVRRPAR
jgi:glycosyltransferase involved in cell wall biosynthesis